jgi:biotin-[acetyl-CoA-carboxylase] ligase BirA-like protein
MHIGLGRMAILLTTFLHSRRSCCLEIATATGNSILTSLLLSMSGRNASSLSSVLSDLSIHHLESVESTQDEARKMLQQNEGKHGAPAYLAVSAKEQTKGRGTSGRSWMGQPGNLFVTIALPKSTLYPDFPLTLLPLQIGNLLAARMSSVLDDCCCASSVDDDSAPRLSLKWPNDVLVNGYKVAGVLMESELVGKEQYFLVGVGVNLVQAPAVPSDGSNRGRPATALLEHCTDEDMKESLVMNGLGNDVTVAQILGDDLAISLVEWWQTTNADSAQQVLDTWKTHADFSLSQTIRDTGEKVQPIMLENDGQLRVRGQDGRERLLVVDYLF